MKLGLLLTPASPIAEQAKAFEGEGFDSIWSAQAMGRGFMMADPLVALAVAAAVTTKVELGTAILQLPIYNPTDVALKAITLSQVSNGRFLMGLGAGSTKSDYEIHQANYNSRFKDYAQCLQELRTTLTDGTAGDGTIGVVGGGPPLMYGTWGKNVAVAATQYDGWIASGMHRTVAQCCDAITSYRHHGGKRAVVSTIHVNGKTDTGKLGADLSAYAQAGFDDAVLFVHPDAPSLATLRKLIP